MPKDLLKNECKNPKLLIEYFGRTQFVLRPKSFRNEEFVSIEKNKQIYKKNIPLYKYLPIFVMNRIPSDIYRIKNPKMVIKHSKNTGYRFVDSFQNQKYQELHQGEAL